MLTEREEKVVAFLKCEGRKWPDSGSDDFDAGFLHAIKWAVECIEDGDHLTWKPEPTIPAEEWLPVSNCGQ